MDRYWRIGGMFDTLKFVSRHYYDRTVVGFVLHNTHDGAIEKFEEMWEEMKRLIPKEYYHDYEFLKIKISSSYPIFIIFDEFYQGERFVEFVEEHFDEGMLAFASVWTDGKYMGEST